MVSSGLKAKDPVQMHIMNRTLPAIMKDPHGSISPTAVYVQHDVRHAKRCMLAKDTFEPSPGKEGGAYLDLLSTVPFPVPTRAS